MSDRLLANRLHSDARITERRPLDYSAPVPGMLVYFIQHDQDGPIKIGTALSPECRMKALQPGNPCELRLLLKLPGGPEEEKALQARFTQGLIRGEWFRPTPELLQLINRPPADLRAYLGLPPKAVPDARRFNIRDLQRAHSQT